MLSINISCFEFCDWIDSFVFGTLDSDIIVVDFFLEKK